MKRRKRWRKWRRNKPQGKYNGQEPMQTIRSMILTPAAEHKDALRPDNGAPPAVVSPILPNVPNNPAAASSTLLAAPNNSVFTVPVLPDISVRSAAGKTAYPCLQGLRFTPRAWAKLLFFLHGGHTEISGYGISRNSNPLLVTDFRTISQDCTPASTVMKGNALSDYLLGCAEEGLHPAECQRIWIHTHPTFSTGPSGIDENTFKAWLGDPPPYWAIMLIVNGKHETYCRLRFNVGPGGDLKLDVGVDWECRVEPCDYDAWKEEFKANINPSWSSLEVPRPDTALPTAAKIFAEKTTTISQRLLDNWNDNVCEYPDPDAYDLVSYGVYWEDIDRVIAWAEESGMEIPPLTSLEFKLLHMKWAEGEAVAEDEQFGRLWSDDMYEWVKEEPGA